MNKEKIDFLKKHEREIAPIDNSLSGDQDARGGRSVKRILDIALG